MASAGCGSFVEEAMFHADDLAEVQIPLNGYAEGLYLARITLDGFVLGETKFTVVK